MIYEANELKKRYEKMTAFAVADCILRTELVGGIGADEQAVRNFVEFQLNLKGEEADKAVHRILTQEIGERNVTPPEGEIQEKLTYGLMVIRRDEFGPWLGDWMIKANLKAAASRLGLFANKRGTKGDMAEMGRVAACGASLRTGYPERIHLVDGAGIAVSTYYQTFKGRVQSPQGANSIVSDRECAPAGSRFSFEFRWYNAKLTEEDIMGIFAAAGQIGLGSAKAFERGKFEVARLEINIPKAAKKDETTA